MNKSRELTIQFDNKQFRGSVAELCRTLRNEYKLTQQQIGDLLGVTRACVSFHLIKAGQRGFLNVDKYESLTTQLFLDNTDEEISSKFNINLLTVARIRRLRGVTKKQVICLNKRRALLCDKLFSAKPGINFKEFIQKLDFESALQKKIFFNFYVYGNLDNASERAYRSKITDNLFEKVSNLSRTDLLEAKVIE